MKSASLLQPSLSLLLILAALAPAEARSQDTLRVLSYNIHGQAPGSDPATRLHYIIEGLRQLDPDIMGIQEINEAVNGGGADNEARIIADSLGRSFGRTYSVYQSAAHLAWDNTFLEYVGIISKYPIEQSGYLDLAAAEFPRKVVWGSITTPAGRVNFFCTHLSNTSPSTRVTQASQTQRYVLDRDRAYPGIASILTGDFNDTPASPTITLLVGSGGTSGPDTTFADTFRELNPSLPGYTVPAEGPSSRIDYVFSLRSGDLEPLRSEVVFGQPYAPGLYPSDHRGVMTTFIRLTSPRAYAPASLTLPTLVKGTHYSALVSVTSTSSVPLVISSVRHANAAFELHALPQLPFTIERRGSSFTMEVDFSPAAAGRYQDSILVATNDPERDTLRIALEGYAIDAVAPSQPGVLYAVSAGNPAGMLFTLDPVSAEATPVGFLRIPRLDALTVRPGTEELYGFDPDGAPALYRVSAASGDAVPAPFPFLGLRTFAFDSADIAYGTNSAGQLYRIALTTGQSQPVGTPTGRNFIGLAMNPATRKLWAAGNGMIDSTFQIDPQNGAVSVIGLTGFSALTRALAFDAHGHCYALIDNGYGEDYLASIDPTTAAGLTVNLITSASHSIGPGILTSIAMSRAKESSLPGDRGPAAPLSFQLLQNYPDPFNPGTTIEFILPYRSHVTLSLINILGQTVMTLADGPLEAGRHRVQLSGAGLASGVYLYRLQAEGHVQTRKCLLLR